MFAAFSRCVLAPFLCIEAGEGDGGGGDGGEGGDEPPPPPAGAQGTAGAQGAAGAAPAAPRRTEVSETAIADVRRRERRKLLREEYGTDNEEEVARIKKQRAEEADQRKREAEELATFKAAEDERKRASQTDLERVTDELTKSKERVQQLERELADTKRQVIVVKQDAVLSQKIASHRFKASRAKYVLRDMAEYVHALPKKEQEKFGDREIDRWLRKYAAENPDFLEPAPAAPAAAAGAGEAGEGGEGTPKPRPAAPAAPARPIRRPVGADKRPPQQRPAPVTDVKKTFAPGKANSMTDAEVKAELKRRGMSGWPGAGRAPRSRYEGGAGRDRSGK